MTNFNSATKSFDLCTEGTSSYAWAWQGIELAAALKDITETNNDIVAYAHGWACELCNACISQIDEDGERGFTAEEITNDLIDDCQSLANALQAWLEDDQDPEDDQDTEEEPQPVGLLICTSSVKGGGMTPASEIYVFSSIEDFLKQNPQWASIELPSPRWHGVTIIDVDLPVQGGHKMEWGGNPTRKSDGYTYYP